MILPCGCHISEGYIPTGYDNIDQPCNIADILVIFHEEYGENWQENEPLAVHLETGLEHVKANALLHDLAESAPKPPTLDIIHRKGKMLEWMRGYLRWGRNMQEAIENARALAEKALS